MLTPITIYLLDWLAALSVWNNSAYAFTDRLLSQQGSQLKWSPSMSRTTGLSRNIMRCCAVCVGFWKEIIYIFIMAPEQNIISTIIYCRPFLVFFFLYFRWSFNDKRLLLLLLVLLLVVVVVIVVVVVVVVVVVLVLVVAAVVLVLVCSCSCSCCSRWHFFFFFFFLPPCGYWVVEYARRLTARFVTRRL